MVDSPLVSVVMPVYNAEEFIDDALESILAQTYKDFRVIISDNCSTDSTLSIIGKRVGDDPRFEVHRQAKNRGPVSNFEYVLAAADTEYFMFAAHDDRWAENYLEALVPALNADPEVVLAVPYVVRMNRDGEIVRTHPVRSYEQSTAFKRIKYGTRKNNAVEIYGLARTAAMRLSFPYCRAFGWINASDKLALFQLYALGKIAMVPQTTFYYTVGSTTKADFSPKTFLERWDVHSRFLRLSWKALKTSGEFSLASRICLIPRLIIHSDIKRLLFSKRPRVKSEI